ncbi:MAG TPA: YCF48-related protein [Thermoleophilaceae bacterium]|jgi:photosystem II stability/assembly factor-like uncharacterized protein
MRKRFAIGGVVTAVVAVAIAAVSAAAPVRTGSSGWTWGNPRPQGNNLTAIDFSGARGYAAGEFGTLLRTDDGGTSWSGIRTALTDDLSKLRVIDADTFVAGGGCTLLRSTDGGQTLRRLRFNPSASCSAGLAAMHFPSRDVGFLVRSDNSVLRTDDGGQRFASRTSLPATGGGAVNDAWFTSADNGVVVTGADTLGKVFRTTDAGQSWNEVATSSALRGVHFVSATVGYAVGQSEVLKTTDGGATWTPRPVAPPSLRQVRCADEMHCVVVSSANVVMFTDDGFDTLENATSPSPGASAVTALWASYASATRSVAIGGTGITWVSDDAAATFARTSAVLPQIYHRLRLTSPSTAFAPGTSGSVARTTDSGATWAAVGVPTTNDIVDVSFPTADLGYAVDVQGAVFRTDNGGGSWAILGEAASGARPNAISAAADGNTVMLVGPVGVLRSADGGQHFDKVDAKAVSKGRFEDVDRVPGAVFLSGAKVIGLTTNEGQSWTALPRPGRGATIEQLDFVDSKTGFVLTSDGRVWSTRDRGKHWTELLTVGHSDAYGLAFGSKNDGYLAVSSFGGSGGGWVLHTSDGGASWRPQLIERNGVASEGLVASSGGVAYALVPGADLFATDTGGDAAASSTVSLATKTRRLRRSGKATVTGRVVPSAPGARVEVDMRDSKSTRWRRQVVTVRSDGTFTTTWTVKRTSYFVAQWAGDQERNGDGSPRLTIVVRR